MLKNNTGRLAKILMNQKKLCHIFTTPQRQYRVTVVGAGGGIGQPLTLLLKQSPLVTQLNLYDLHHSAGVGADLSHIETPALVCSFMGLDQLKLALCGSDIVTIVAGVPRKPGMSRDDLFSVNANIIRDVFCGIAKHCPKALVSIVTNPVNSLVPLAAEIMDIHGVFDPCKLFGVTTLDVVRANTFIAELKGLNPLDVNCPCIGGHAGATIIPVISQCCPRVEFTEPQLKELIKKVQEAGTEVVKAKEGKGSATLSTAFATARLTFAMCRGLRGEKGVVECSYVRSDVTDAKFFSTPLVLGKNGIEKNLGLGKLTECECEQVRNAIPQIQKSIEEGINFVHNLAKK